MSWFAVASGKRGRSPQFSDALIQFYLTIKNLFGRALRQTTGFVQSLLALSGLTRAVPDFSTLCLHQWHKLHIGIDSETLQLSAICVTSNNVTDAAVMPQLLEQIPAEELLLTVIGDGAYDTQPVHAAVIERSATPIIPPRKNALMRKGDTFAHRNAAIAACRRFGRKLRKSWSGYNRRSLVETKMHCIKRLGERVMSRTFDRQIHELHIRAAILNKFTELGRPQTVAVV